MINLIRKYNLCGVIMLTWKFNFSFANFSEALNPYICKGVFRDKLSPSLIEKKLYFHENVYSAVGKTLSDVHKQWSKYFNENGVPDPDLSTRYIIQHVLNMKESYEYDLSMGRKITEDEGRQIRKLCECRLARMPVQYIIKEWDFRDLKLAMCPPVFIPRPETEQLVDLVLEKAALDSVFMEVGCGTGAICLSLLKALPQAHVVAIDQSKMACKLTKKNAKLNNITSNLQVVHTKLKDDGSLSEPLDLDCLVDVLVSNPPYVPTVQLHNLQPEIKLYEDLRALEAGRDGLRVVQSLLTLAKSILKPQGLIFLEVDSTHPKLIAKWVAAHPELNIEFVRSYKDFCDKDRFVELKKL